MAVRQAARQVPLAQSESVHIPKWHDAAQRERAQQTTSPLFVTGVTTSKLDDIATDTYHAAPDDIARLGFAVANLIDSSVAAPTNLSTELKQLAEKIAKSLMAAQRPVIISGVGCSSDAVMKAAANVAWALHKKKKMRDLC